MNVIPIQGPDNQARIYLELLPDEDRGTVLVRPGPSGRRLPKLWATWLRELIMFELADPQVTDDVTLLGDRVIVRSNDGLERALAIAQVAAGKIHQLPGCPLVPIPIWSSGVSLRWRIDGMEERVTVGADGRKIHDDIGLYDDQLAAQKIANSIRLPPGVRLEVDFGHERVRGEYVKCITITLCKEPDSTLKLCDVGNRVKLAFTLSRVHADASAVAV